MQSLPARTILRLISCSTDCTFLAPSHPILCPCIPICCVWLHPNAGRLAICTCDLSASVIDCSLVQVEPCDAQLRQNLAERCLLSNGSPGAAGFCPGPGHHTSVGGCLSSFGGPHLHLHGAHYPQTAPAAVLPLSSHCQKWKNRKNGQVAETVSQQTPAQEMSSLRNPCWDRSNWGDYEMAAIMEGHQGWVLHIFFVYFFYILADPASLPYLESSALSLTAVISSGWRHHGRIS